MKKKKVVMASVLGLALLVLTAGSALAANANGNRAERRFGNLTAEQITQRQAEMTARRAAMDKAIEDGNYDAWVTVVKEQMGEDAPMLSKVTAANFSQFAEAHRLMRQANEKFAALGLEMNGQGKGMMRHGGFGRMMPLTK